MAHLFLQLCTMVENSLWSKVKPKLIQQNKKKKKKLVMHKKIITKSVTLGPFP